MQAGSYSRRLIGQIIRPWIATNRVVSLVRAWTNWHIVFGLAGWRSVSPRGVGSGDTGNVTSTSHNRRTRVSAIIEGVFSAVGGCAD